MKGHVVVPLWCCPEHDPTRLPTQGQQRSLQRKPASEGFPRDEQLRNHSRIQLVCVAHGALSKLVRYA